MSRLLKGLVCVVVALALAGAPMVASAAPVREQSVVSLLEAAWARVIELWSGVVGSEKDGPNVPPVGIVACSATSCSPPAETDVGANGDPNG